MRYVFRIDASPLIGAGHVMRSSAIAEEMISRGLHTVFVGEISDMPWLANRIENLGFTEIHKNTKDFKSRTKTDILILDSYELPIKDGFIQTENWKLVINIFDSSTPSYKCQMRIHPGITDDWEQLPKVFTLAGVQYIPLRSSLQKQKKEITDPLQIIITGGGSDSNNFVEAILGVLSESEEDFQASIFTNHPFLPILDNRFQFKSLGIDFDLAVSKTDLAFTTASTTCLEFLATGSAIGIGCAVQNQESNYLKLGELEIACLVGIYLNGSWELNKDSILEIVSSKYLREKLQWKARNYIDLNGAVRIVDNILDFIATS